MRGDPLSQTHLGRRRRALAALAAGGLLTTGLTAATTTAAGAAATEPSDLYVVQLGDQPVSGYDGRVRGFARTAPAKGAKVDVDSAASLSYTAYLDRQQAKVLERVEGEEVVYSYRVALNGFAARMSPRAAEQLRRAPGVLAVTVNEVRTMDTITTPDFLGLRQPDGLWSKTGGINGRAGAGTVVGIIDSGIWPESPSFAGTGKAPERFKHDCQGGESFPATLCNSKLVVAKYFNQTVPPQSLNKGEYKSARDGDGHGTHTASTAAGNSGVPAVIEGRNLGAISGMAPGAMVAAYKVCWNGDDGGCGTADSVAAIDAAVGDGVDVINYSISGSLTTTFADPVENAFFYAAGAGVFIAASAGNSGPDESTVAHNSPWLTTVAAGTHDRDGKGTVTLGNGTTYEGKSITAAVGPAPLVNSTAVGVAGADAGQLKLCFPGTLDPAKVTGAIVTCARGVIGRTTKSQAVRAAGGVGMVLYNTSENSVNADAHFVPTVHVDHVAGPAITKYAADAGATASLSQGVIVQVEAPEVAAFSSRGPALASSGDLIKPDIMAPGVDVLASVAPPSNSGRTVDFLSGTSMSSPHIAGIGALMKALHPTWSPAAIKSALMTTAAQTTNRGNPIAGNAFDYGSGQVVPNSAAAPGLVYDAGPQEWRSFAAGTGQCRLCGGASPAVPKDASDLNYPSIAMGSLAGAQTVTRSVTNVTKSKLDVTAQVVAPPGTTVTVAPSTLSVDPGKTATFKIKVERTDATFDSYTFGSITWTGGGFTVRSPIAVRPVAIAAPEALSGKGASGTQNVTVTAGYTGVLTATVDGLVAATTDVATYADGNAGDFSGDDPASMLADPSVKRFVVQVPAGRTYARWSTFADASSAVEDDIDLYVYRRDGADLVTVGSSATGSSDETVSVNAPAAGTYDVYVHNWDSDVATNDITLFGWQLDGAVAGNATATPATQQVVTGTTYDITFGWSGLSAGARYLGRLVYGNGTAPVGSTVVSVTG